MLSAPYADPCQHSVKIYTSCIMAGCGCNSTATGATGGSRRKHSKRHTRSRKHSKRHTRSRKHKRSRHRRSRRGGNTFIPQTLVNTFRNVSNAMQTKYADLTGGPLPISPNILHQTPINKPSEPSLLSAIKPSPNSPTKKVSPFRQKK